MISGYDGMMMMHEQSMFDELMIVFPRCSMVFPMNSRNCHQLSNSIIDVSQLFPEILGTLDTFE
jgi:hypothetical protein